jgi:hypothetical protein
MLTQQGFKFPGLFTGLAAAALAVGCATAPPRAERYVPPPLGASWIYQVTSSGSFGSLNKAPMTVTLSEAPFEGRTLLRFSSPASTTLQTDRVGVVAALDPAGRPLMRYDPPLGYEWPLEVGKTWTQDITLTVGASTKVPMKAMWTVEAYEDVTVPAGTFKAWRIVMTDNFGFRQVTWSVPEKLGVYARRTSERPATHPQGGAGQQVVELVTVPTVK